MPQLTWLGDSQAKRAARRVPYRLLETRSVHGDPAAPNWLIQGDNLDALKALLPFCAGRVKCIFIDPPYNTKSAFEHYDDNLEHSQWLSMMYPRLELLRDLLAEDGSIWVTIDDNEGHYLKVVMDEVFGRSNFVSNVVWQKAYTSNQTAKHLSDTHDHLLLYAKSFDQLAFGKLNRTETQVAKFKNPDEDPRGPWKAENLSAGKFYSAGQFTIIGPTGERFTPPKGRYWRCNEEQYQDWLNDGRITFGIQGTGRPMLKKFISEMQDGLTANSWWNHEEFGSNKQASIDLKSLFSDAASVFATPKPELLISKALQLATNPNDLVLDSFLGSGTTAAVAHKMGRRWIGIEMGEHARTHCLPRLQKVIDGEQGGVSESVGWKGGGGFRFLTLGEPVFAPDGGISPGVRFGTLAGYLWFLETGVPWAGDLGAPASGRPEPGAPRREEAPSETRRSQGPLLGIHADTAVVLLYNGILGDRRPDGGNVLTSALWREIEPLAAAAVQRWVIYGEAARMPEARRRELGILFKQIPYDIRMR